MITSISWMVYFCKVQQTEAAQELNQKWDLFFCFVFFSFMTAMKASNSPAQLLPRQLVIARERVFPYPAVDFRHHSFLAHPC